MSRTWLIQWLCTFKDKTISSEQSRCARWGRRYYVQTILTAYHSAFIARLFGLFKQRLRQVRHSIMASLAVDIQALILPSSSSEVRLTIGKIGASMLDVALMQVTTTNSAAYDILHAKSL